MTKTNRRIWLMILLLVGMVLAGVGALLDYSIRTYHVRVGWLQRWHLGTEPAIFGAPGSLDSDLGMKARFVGGTLFSLGFMYVFVPERRTGATR
jgi:hypothetical protein